MGICRAENLAAQSAGLQACINQSSSIAGLKGHSQTLKSLLTSDDIVGHLSCDWLRVGPVDIETLTNVTCLQKVMTNGFHLEMNSEFFSRNAVPTISSVDFG